VLARVRTNRVYIEVKGIIPGALLQCLRDEYGRRLILKCEWGERLPNVLDAPFYEREPGEMSPGAWLRYFRQDGGLSQAKLGQELGGVSHQNVSHMEYGRRQISRQMALRLSSFFGVRADKFIG
jgi:DNA-binding XRE family transcriptional regulator